jgi:hypothetical protein
VNPELVGLVAVGIVVLVILAGIAAILTCALDANCRARAGHDGKTIVAYGSTAAAGAWDGNGPLTRRAPQSFPVLPALPYAVAGIMYLAKKVSDHAKSKQQKASERAVWDEASKGLSKAEKRRLHDLLEGIKGEMKNADPEDIIDERNALFPDNPYPGGWLLP